MAGISGLGTTFNLPNFHGVLYGLTPEDTPFASAIGVMSNGGEATLAKDFEWQTYDLRDPEIPANLEGQDAPTARERVRASVNNVTQIFHSKVSVSYSKLAASAQRDGLNQAIADATPSEMEWQVAQELKALKRDIEKVFIQGVYAKPSDNLTARKSRGILEAISTNVNSRAADGVAVTATASTDRVSLTSHGLLVGQPVVFSDLTGGAGITAGTVYYVKAIPTTGTFTLAATPGGALIDITSDMTGGTMVKYQSLRASDVEDLMQDVWDNGGIQEQETATIMVNSGLKRQLSKVFIKDQGYEESSRTIAGVSVQTIETDFGKLNIMLNRHMPIHTLAVVSLEVCRPRTLLIPNKGFLFLEELAKTGASDNAQIYGEIGLEYGAELQHGKLTGLSPVVDWNA